ncbi:MAG TPA: flagellar hook-basal body complex protein [Vitreimonas sp.]|uniref:flagellar hook-basal body complex protein n=1 Tax=Vitreimonas sp. TaxID=3069702 RepID=UPI002D31DBF1|nr:flagellar hook-basal body complex protein [Vitreimonas sp.]HYD85994.1 flagellar hook-basal body complex protein [Vitreimonas sp.]
MLGSIFIGLSGMNAFSRGLRQISNNITNINSTGYKASDLGFVNLFGGGGGQGVAMSEGRIDFTQGELRQTDRDLDLAIDGGGFLVLLKDAEHVFTRTGSFEVNADGDIVLAGTDYKLTVLDSSGAPTTLSIAGHRTSPPQATSQITFSDNLSSSATSFNLSNVKVFSADGQSDTWQIKFARSETSPAGEWTVKVVNGAGAEVGSRTLRFIGSIADPAASKLTFGEGDETIELDFSAATSFSSGEVSTLRVSDANGYGGGEIAAMGVNDDGEFEIVYSNEEKVTLGAVTIASFTDPQALQAQSRGLFSYDGANGRQFLTSANASVGKVVSGRLESSNVDLSREFGELILVQRGYQASSQVISVSNDMIQQLFGIRGQ